MRTRLSLPAVSAIAVTMALIALADAQISQVSLWPFYIGPVLAASWFADFRDGATTALAAAGLIIVATGFSGHPYATDLYFLIATTSRLGALLVIAWLANRLAATQSLLLRLLRPDQEVPHR